MAAALSNENKHVAVIAFPFGSHPFSLLNQAIRLAHAAPNVTFSFFNIATSNQSLFNKQPNIIPQNIKPYNVSDGMPEDHAPGTLLPLPKLVDLFLEASLENLEQAIDLAVETTNQRLTCILSDTFVSSPSLSLSHKLNVPWVASWPGLSSSVSPHFYTHLLRHKFNNAPHDQPDISTSLDFLPGLSHLRVEDLPPDVLLKTGQEDEETVFSKTLASTGQVLPQARALVLCFYEELDPPLFVQDMKSKLTSLLYIGPPLSQSDSDSHGCLPWLDQHGSRSVAYLGFGSVATLPRSEFLEVSAALESSGIPFLWALKDDQKSLLPDGFVERTRMRGKIVPWAPQTQVLAHGSVGVFVTHCGSNSVIESMANGVPMICRPFFGDHMMAARMVVDLWGIGVKIQGGVFSKNGLLQSLNLILEEEEGKKIRENALKMKKAVQIAAGAEGKAAQDFETLVEIITTS